ncbi:MAG TPA: hypothetical protein EYO58_06895 [Flavobacteriales bacterium]|nr:hypothetical protein [Flavobacteriales bacterium]
MRHGDYLAEYNGDLLFHSNIFYVGTGEPDFNNGCNNCTFQGNLFYTASGGTLVDPQEIGSTNIMNQQPMFVNPDFDGADTLSWSLDRDYHLVVGSPGIGDGLYGQDVGIHGNLFNFNMSGRPSGVPIITLLSKAYDIVPVDAPLEIEIETETAE